MRKYSLILVLGLMISACSVSETLSGKGDGSSSIGDTAVWAPGGTHQVAGTATILDAVTLQVSNFTFDGGGPAVYFILGKSDTSSAYINGKIIGPQLNRAYSDETFTITLTGGDALTNYSAISVWCVDFSVSFDSGVFE